jgi:hypothetical protein
LPVVLDGQLTGSEADGTISRQRRHDDAIVEGDITDPDGVEK